MFNYLFARHHGGEFLLRIEDTDRERSTQQAVDVILQGLDWLGLVPDEPPVFQSSRAARHAEAAQALLAAGPRLSMFHECRGTARDARARDRRGPPAPL